MIETPVITETTAQPTAVIHLQIPKDQIQQAMGPAISEVMAAVAAQGQEPAGPWFTHHFRIDANGWDFEVGVPVEAVVKPAGRVAPGRRPAMRVARTVHRGPYEGLGPAWGQLGEWLESNGHRPAADLWECYLAGPDADPDPATFRTQLDRPLVR
jgi:effector-binding domain-containing protein